MDKAQGKPTSSIRPELARALIKLGMAAGNQAKVNEPPLVMPPLVQLKLVKDTQTRSIPDLFRSR